MQCVTAVEPEWLAELGPMFFSIKSATETRLLGEWQQAKGERPMILVSGSKRKGKSLTREVLAHSDGHCEIDHRASLGHRHGAGQSARVR